MWQVGFYSHSILPTKKPDSSNDAVYTSHLSKTSSTYPPTFAGRSFKKGGAPQALLHPLPALGLYHTYLSSLRRTAAGGRGKGPEAGTGQAEKQGRATRRAAPRPWVHMCRAWAAPLGLGSPSREVRVDAPSSVWENPPSHRTQAQGSRRLPTG